MKNLSVSNPKAITAIVLFQLYGGKFPIGTFDQATTEALAAELAEMKAGAKVGRQPIDVSLEPQAFIALIIGSPAEGDTAEVVGLFPNSTSSVGRTTKMLLRFNDVKDADGKVSVEGSLTKYNRIVRDAATAATGEKTAVMVMTESKTAIETFLGEIEGMINANGGHAKRPLGSAWSNADGSEGPLMKQTRGKIERVGKAITKAITDGEKATEAATATKASALQQQVANVTHANTGKSDAAVVAKPVVAKPKVSKPAEAVA